jgi:ribosomal protein S27E
MLLSIIYRMADDSKTWYQRNRQKVLDRLKERLHCDRCGHTVSRSQYYNHRKTHLCRFGIRKPRKDKIYASNSDKIKSYYRQSGRVSCELCGRTVSGWYLKKHQQNRICHKNRSS